MRNVTRDEPSGVSAGEGDAAVVEHGRGDRTGAHLLRALESPRLGFWIRDIRRAELELNSLMLQAEVMRSGLSITVNGRNSR